MSRGSAQPNVNSVSLRSLKVPLPPLAEQHRIVTKVEEFHTLCDQLEEEQQQVQTRKQALNAASLHQLSNAEDSEDFQSAWNIVSSRFEQLHDQPESVEPLRQAILQLAVRGKLVKQDPNDEPASELLKRIAQEKGELVANNKIRRTQPFQVNTSNRKSLNFTLGWASCFLQDVILQDLGGGTPSKRETLYWGGKIKWASVKDVGKTKYLSSTIDHITQPGLDNSSSNLIPSGWLLVCVRMGLGKISISSDFIAINQDIRALHPSSGISLEFLYLLLKAKEISGAGMTVQGIKREQLLTLGISLPPLAEQHRIVAKVDELMALCDQLEQQLTQSRADGQRLLQSILAEVSL